MAAEPIIDHLHEFGRDEADGSPNAFAGDVSDQLWLHFTVPVQAGAFTLENVLVRVDVFQVRGQRQDHELQ